VAWLLWLVVHIVYLISFRNRLQVLVDWAWNYFTSRGTGAILFDAPESPSCDVPANECGANAGTPHPRDGSDSIKSQQPGPASVRPG
jgi:hypothetical protein